jgi:hypothetical protein
MPLPTIAATLLRRFELPQPWRRYPIQVALVEYRYCMRYCNMHGQFVFRALRRRAPALRLSSMKSPVRESSARGNSSFPRFSWSAFGWRTPAPPPFSSMNSLPSVPNSVSRLNAAIRDTAHATGELVGASRRQPFTIGLKATRRFPSKAKRRESNFRRMPPQCRIPLGI